MTRSNNAPQGLFAGMAFGGLFFLVGAFIVMIAANIIPVDESSFNAPRWVIGAAGLVFMLAGTMVALQSAFRPNPEQSLLYLWLTLFLGTFFMIVFSSLFIWVGFGPGEREFSSSSSFGPVTTSGAGNASFGRLIFGGSGILMLLMTFVMTYANWKKIRDFDG